MATFMRVVLVALGAAVLAASFGAAAQPVTPDGTVPATGAATRADGVSGTGAPATTGTPAQPTAKTNTAPGAPTKSQEARLRELEERVVALKEGVFAAKTRLTLLRDRVLSNTKTSGAVMIVLVNDMGSAFTLQSYSYEIDGKDPKYVENKSGLLSETDRHILLETSPTQGSHVLNVELVYKGSGGLFTYLEGYQFKLNSSYTFYVTPGKILVVEIVGYEKGGITYSMEERPAIQIKAEQYEYSNETLNRLRERKGKTK